VRRVPTVEDEVTHGPGAPQAPPSPPIAPEAASSPATQTRERRALGVFAVIAAGGVLWLSWPFLTALVIGALLAFALEPACHALTRITRKTPLAAVITVILAGVVIVSALGGFASLFVSRTVHLSTIARQDLKSGGPFSHMLATLSGWAGRFGVDSAQITERIQSSIGEIAARAGSLAAALASSTFALLLGLFFALLTMYVVLRHWQRIVQTLVTASPLDESYTEELLGEFRRIGQTTLSGTVLTAVVQGSLAAVGYWLTGVPYPIFFGVTTAFASLLPAVGTLLVWVPVGLYLLGAGNSGAAIAELLWGALIVVGACDYVIRPRLVREDTMPALLVFIALFGGLEVIGLAGLIVGPLVMGLALAVLRLYVREKRAGAPPS
jgi:predicted PurR-regulated permease PerM